MNKKRIILYVSSAVVWAFIVFCTLWQDNKTYSVYDYYEQEQGSELAINDHVSIYGPLSTGETQVSLKFGEKELNAVVSEKINNISANHNLFPADKNHVGITFKNENNLDTLVLFNDNEAQVFYHVIAMSSDTGRVASLEQTDTDGINLVISTFEHKIITTVELKNLTSSFLEEPQIENAIFIGSEFKLDTAFGNYLIPLPSLI